MTSQFDDRTNQVEEDDKIRLFIKSGYNLLQRKRDRLAATADEIKTGMLSDPDGINKYADVLTDLNSVQYKLDLLETIIRNL